MSDASIGAQFARRREAGDFLRSRRGRLAPSKVGLPDGFRRRTPGLRREEVAMLAGVGTTWYTWLEQGREIQPSNEVLTALADVLQLDRAERQHLFLLYDRAIPDQRASSEAQVDEALQRMVEGLAGQPAFVLSWRWDILAWNKAAAVLVGLDAGLRKDGPNVLDLLFSEPARRLFADWTTVVRGAIATFRADCTAYVGEQEFEAFIARLSRTNPEFAALWSEHDVAHRLAGRKHLHHPIVGAMGFDFSMLAIGGRPGMKLCIFTAIQEDGTPGKLRRLLAQPPLVA